MVNFSSRDEMLSIIPQESTGAEIGVLWGDFSRIILDIVKPVRLYLVDCWAHQEGEYKYEGRNFNQETHDATYKAVAGRFSAEPAAKIIRKFSVEAAQDIADSSLDFVYIDANHTYNGVMGDLLDYEPKIKNGGIIMGHDYIDCPEKHFGVIPAVGAFCLERGWKMIAKTTDDWPSYALKKI
jgi:hypothetical protein